MGAKRTRTEADHKHFSLYEVKENGDLKLVGPVSGFSGADAHLRAVRAGTAKTGVAYVTISDRNLGVNIVEESAPATPRLTISNVSGGRAASTKKAPAASKAKPAAKKAPAAKKPAAPKAPKKPGTNPFAE